MEAISRAIQPIIESHIQPHKAVLLFGARRVGKTFLMKTIIGKQEGKALMLNGEDADVQALLAQRSVANYKRLLEGVDLLAIDEAQHIPEIGAKLKLIVDELGVKVIASGSSSFDLLNQTGEPLVGRSFQYQLFPFSQTELSSTENALETRANLNDRLVYGSYPETVMLKSNADRADYLRSVADAYLLKDILALDGLRNSAKMRDLLRLIAFQMGSEVSYDELGKQLGMSKNTVSKYLDLLSKAFVVYRLGAFSGNLRKEVTKAGKWYFWDNGIRNAVLNNFAQPSIRQDVGQLWENYLLSERMKRNLNLGLHRSPYFWRVYGGQELDYVEEVDGTISTFEIKWGNKHPKMPSAFAAAYPDASFEVINRDNYLDFIG